MRAIVKAQHKLRDNIDQATDIGSKLFPATEVAVIADMVRRNLPFYDAAISRESIDRMITFSHAADILHRTPSCEEIVATEFEPFWRI